MRYLAVVISSSQRERAVAILPLEDGMVLHTLNEPRDLYSYDKLFERVRAERSAGEEDLLEVEAAEARVSEEEVWRKGNLGTVGVR